MIKSQTATHIESKFEPKASESSLLESNSASSDASGKPKIVDSESNSVNKLTSSDSNNDNEIINLDHI